jgi:hypothetical protein
MATPIIKVAKTGFDVRTASVKNLTLDSTKNHLKLKLTTTITLNTPI